MAPAIVDAVNPIDWPSQTGLLFPTLGDAGNELMVKVTFAALEVPQAAVVAVTLYIPAIESFTFKIIGFCWVEPKPFGPVQLKVEPGIPIALNCKFCPGQSGPLLLAVGVGVLLVMVTKVFAANEAHPFTVATTL